MENAQKAKSIPRQNQTSENISVFGIGFSDGGLVAIENFLINIPSNNGISFVVIHHLPPNPKSNLADLISGYTELKVIQVVDRVELMPNSIYIIPLGFDMSLKKNDIILSVQSQH